MFKIEYDIVGVAANITWNDGIVLDTSGNVTIGNNITVENHNYLGHVEFIDDDGVYSFTPGKTRGLILIRLTYTAQMDFWALINYRCPAAAAISKLLGHANVSVLTGILNGTTGANGDVTVSCHTDNKIYVENRCGTGQPLDWVLLTGN